MISKEMLESWYTPKKLGKMTGTSKENHAKKLAEIFDTVPFEERVKIVKWLSDNDFEDTVREIYDEHCSDCWGTGKGGYNDDGEMTACLCVHEAAQAADANAKWAERE